MNENDTNKGNIIVSYRLTSYDIIKLILSIHFALLVLPIAFLLGYILLEVSSRFLKWEAFITFVLFFLSILCVIFVYSIMYLKFKKTYYFSDQNRIYYSELSELGIKVYNEGGRNQTEYLWNDFFKCRETKKTAYLYFSYDKALIIKKQLFIAGDEKSLSSILRANIIKYKGKQEKL